MNNKKTIYDVYRSKINLKRKLEIEKLEVAIKLRTSNEQLRDIMREKEILPKIWEFVRAVVHFNYENYLNVLTLDSKEITRYLNNKHISPPTLSIYNANQIDNMFVLLVMETMLEENIKVNQENLDILLMLLNCETLTLVDLAKIGIKNPVNLALLQKLRWNNFTFDFLTDEEKKLIDKYHDKYNREEIYPLVNQDSVDDKKDYLERVKELTLGR